MQRDFATHAPMRLAVDEIPHLRRVYAEVERAILIGAADELRGVRLQVADLQNRIRLQRSGALPMALTFKLPDAFIAKHRGLLEAWNWAAQREMVLIDQIAHPHLERAVLEAVPGPGNSLQIRSLNVRSMLAVAKYADAIAPAPADAFAEFRDEAGNPRFDGYEPERAAALPIDPETKGDNMSKTPKLAGLHGAFANFTATVEAAADQLHKRMENAAKFTVGAVDKYGHAVGQVEAIAQGIDDAANQMTNGGPPLEGSEQAQKG